MPESLLNKVAVQLYSKRDSGTRTRFLPEHLRWLLLNVRQLEGITLRGNKREIRQRFCDKQI